MHLGKRQVPEIDGSQGAFIGVVVALSVLIVVCCAAVFYLLRHHEPTDQDRSARRERYRRTREQTLNSSLTSSGPSSRFGSGSLGDKVKQVWQSTTGRGRAGGGGGGGGRRGVRGWIRAGSDDEWGSHSGHEGGGADHSDPEVGSSLRPLPVLKQDTQAHARGVDGIRVVESPLSDTTSGFVSGQFGYTYTDPFSKTASDGALQRSQSPLSSSSSPVSSPRESGSVDDCREAYSPASDDRRHRSMVSNGSVWTHAGSKFVEDI
ncbi:hypothetical protein OG21DRAFT_1511447 [Imleria badia]|nr:hypothetical protein OG21DRAFT_1511447 [Imleria badia]